MLCEINNYLLKYESLKALITELSCYNLNTKTTKIDRLNEHQQEFNQFINTFGAKLVKDKWSDILLVLFIFYFFITFHFLFFNIGLG